MSRTELLVLKQKPQAKHVFISFYKSASTEIVAAMSSLTGLKDLNVEVINVNEVAGFLFLMNLCFFWVIFFFPKMELSPFP